MAIETFQTAVYFFLGLFVAISHNPQIQMDFLSLSFSLASNCDLLTEIDAMIGLECARNEDGKGEN